MKGLYQKRGWFYYQSPKPKGQARPKAVALETQDEIEAINKATDMQWGDMILKAETKGTLEEILPQYYAAKSDDTKKTRHGREQILNAFKDLMGNPRVATIDRALILEWRGKLASTGGSITSSKPVSPTTMTSYLIVLRAFFNWCVKEKMIRKNPAQDMGKQSSVRATRRMEFHTLEERELILAKPGREWIEFVNYTGFFAGLRIGEMLAMQPEWLHIAPDRSYGSIRVQPTMIKLTDGTGMLWVPKTKRGIRTIPMHKRLIDFFARYGMRQPYMLASDQPLFPTDTKKSLRFDPKNGLRRHAIECGLKKSNYHIPFRTFLGCNRGCAHGFDKGQQLLEHADLGCCGGRFCLSVGRFFGRWKFARGHRFQLWESFPTDNKKVY